MNPGYWAFALTVAALGVFLMGTRQFALWVRVLILLAGVGLLAGASALVAGMEGHYGLFRAVGDLLANIGHPGDSVLVSALRRNEASAIRHILPLLDLFLIVAALLGLIAIFALTPGEFIERMARPLTFTLVGMMLGAALALSVVAIGFGGNVDPRGYAGMVDDDDVHDGDTFWVGETSLRLFGVDAPERRQVCGIRLPTACGDLAAQHLRELTSGALVRCVVRVNSRGNVAEAFGRPLVQCFARYPEPPGGKHQEGRSLRRDEEIDIGEQMISDGYAIAYRGGERETLDSYRDAELTARANRSALFAGCWLDPKHWRNEPRERADFRAGRLEEISAHLVGNGCSLARPQ